MLPCVAAVAIAVFAGKKYYGSHVSETSSLLMQNVEALATGTESQDDCHYSNGYTAFTGKKGGAYDCCKVGSQMLLKMNIVGKLDCLRKKAKAIIAKTYLQYEL